MSIVNPSIVQHNTVPVDQQQIPNSSYSYNNNWLVAPNQDLNKHILWTPASCYNNTPTVNNYFNNEQNYYQQEAEKENELKKESINKHLSSYQTTLFTTQKLNNSTAKLSYTPYQLELLNSIYKDMKYPNSVQKTLIAKLIGITRDQVKVS